MFTVSRPCQFLLNIAAWVVFIFSLLIIFAAMGTGKWLFQDAQNQYHGLVDCCDNFCCPRFHCFPKIDIKDYLDATIAILVTGILVSVIGIIASMIVTLCKRQVVDAKCSFFIATLTLLGGLLLLIAMIYYANNVPQHINSIKWKYCVGNRNMDVNLGDSFRAFVVGSVGVLLAALPLFFAVLRDRQPSIVGDFVAGETALGTTAGADRPQDQPQTAESRMDSNVETVEMNRLRPEGSNAQPSINHAFDFWVTPSSPEFDLIEIPEPFHAIPEQPRLHCPFPEPLEIQYEATEMCSVSERPTLHLQIPEPPEAEYETLDHRFSTFVGSPPPFTICFRSPPPNLILPPPPTPLDYSLRNYF